MTITATPEAEKPLRHNRHGIKLELHRTQSGLTSTPERLSIFQRVADKVSYGMGTPTNIVIWIVAVGAWIAAGPFFATHPFLPGWFTSNGFNFPLNTVTTIAELYIGFLVGASANRSERNLEATLGRIEQTETGVTQLITANTDLTRQVHGQTSQLTHMQAELNALRTTLCPDAPNPAAGTDSA